jgi:alpha-1,6-mannosyltransferase
VRYRPLAGGAATRPAGGAASFGGERGGPHLLDTTMLYAPHSGGVTRYLREKRAWLARNTPMRHTLLVPALRDGVGPCGEILVRTRAFTRSPYRWPYDCARWLREIYARAPDLIEAGDPGPLGWIALRAATHLDVPLVAFCHADVLRMVDVRVSPALRLVVREYLRAFYGRCHVVVAPSRYMKERLARCGVERVVVRPLGVDLATFGPYARTGDLRRRLALPRGTRVCVYAGRVAPEKNIDVLMDAFRVLRHPYHLVMAVSGPVAGAPSNVTLLPFVESAADLAALLASADALVHAGDQETFGLVLLEAMACGRGVIAPAAGAAPELVDETCGMLVRPRDARALAAGVAAFYERGADALGANARRRVEQGYSWDSAMRGLLGVYRGALARATRVIEGYAAP